MKKFLFLMMSVAIALSASANVKTLKAPKMSPRSMAAKFERVPQIKTEKVLPGQFLMKKAPMRAAGDVISTQPEGELKTYVRSGEAIVYDSDNDQLSLALQSGNMSVVFADNDKVYLKDPVYGLTIGTWVEGTISGNKITVPTNQYLYWSSSGYGLILVWGDTYMGESVDEETGETSEYLDFAADETVTEITYTIDGDIITLDNSVGDVYNFDAEATTGLAAIWDDDLSWQGYMEWNTVLTLTDNPPVMPIFDPSTMITEQPEGQLVEYTLTGDAIVLSGSSLYLSEQSGTVNIVYDPDGETVYIQNPIYGFSQGTWVRGTISGNKITVPMGQFIYYSSGGYGLILSWGSVNSSGSYTADYSVTEITYTIDGNTISLDNSVGAPVSDGFSGCTGLAIIWSDDESWQGYINWNTVYNMLDEAQPAVPSDPEILEWTDSGSEDGYSNLYFKINTEDVDGVQMHESNMSYSIYVDDDEIFTFDAATYAADNTTIFADGVDLTEIPYNVRDYDFFPQRCYFYRTNKGDNPMFQNRIGIQVHNTVDGVKNSSNIVYLEVLPPAPAVPADPTNLTWSDGGNENGYSRLGFTMPTTDVDGNSIDQTCLSYSVYLDYDQLFTFDAATYAASNDDVFADGVDLTEIPYGVSDYDFGTSGVYFYRTNAEGYDPFFIWRIGIQAHYTVDGVKNSSNIVYIEVFEEPQTGKIGDVNGDNVVDIEDVTTLISKVLGNNPDPFIEENANVDGVGGIDIEDVTALITKVLGSND
jgi:hypothetical protein